MLTLGDDAFTSGRAEYTDMRPATPGGDPKIYVRFKVADLPVVWVAALDTGASWTCLASEIASEMGVDAANGEKIRIGTRWGSVPGALVPNVALTILADEGDSLRIDATVFVPTIDDSPFHDDTYFGYRGLLERIRLALDPQKNLFYFGEAT